jgi:hypothetical protein
MTADAGNGSDLAGISSEETAKTAKRIMRIMGALSVRAREYGMTISLMQNASVQDTRESARQSKCSQWQFVLVLANGQKNHSVQQPEGDEV